MKSDFADTTDRSQLYAKVRNSLLQLSRLPADPRHWRPHLVVLAQGLGEPLQLLEYAVLLGGLHGIVSRVGFLQGSLKDAAARRHAELARVEQLTAERAPSIFNEVIVAPDAEAAVPVFLQAHALGPLKPNLAVLAYPGDTVPTGTLIGRLRALVGLEISCVVLLNIAGRRLLHNEPGRVDIWWRGFANGSLMLILAHMLTLNPSWRKVRVRILRIARTEAERQNAHDELKHLIEVSRIDAEIRILVSTDPFTHAMRKESRDAAALFLGFVLPDESQALVTSFESTARALEGMPPAFLTCTSGAADLLA
jgi:hypothetical protein